ncbi:hypothetical protein DSM3645_21022 [Blastopirellula marina DSM 3645]|uniref:Uncharacterized protein n=1 Tax=Blastopirellula marina DSM 3645 TaxID=314230 RepID=A3ZR01_9BACT|nr:hypothetical protein DSM3645_21022 [Blastopirellula marina DSM 3645]
MESPSCASTILLEGNVIARLMTKRAAIRNEQLLGKWWNEWGETQQLTKSHLKLLMVNDIPAIGATRLTICAAKVFFVQLSPTSETLEKPPRKCSPTVANGASRVYSA